MRMPGFTAEDALYKTNGRFRAQQYLRPANRSVNPAQLMDAYFDPLMTIYRPDFTLSAPPQCDEYCSQLCELDNASIGNCYLSCLNECAQFWFTAGLPVRTVGGILELNCYQPCMEEHISKCKRKGRKHGIHIQAQCEAGAMTYCMNICTI